MRPDRDIDWATRSLRKRDDRITERRSELKAVERAAISASHVTGDEHWDFLLSAVKAKIEALEGTREAALDLLKTSDDFTTEKLINQKLAVRLLGREIEALQWVIGLPKELMEQGDQAKQLLGSVDESSG
jgi:hypothetical protein